MKRRIGYAPLLCAAVLLFGLAAGARSYPMASSQTTPGASGKVDIQKTKNGNTQVEIRVEHLAQPGMLTPPASNYVIWFQEEKGQPVNAGQIRVGKDLKGDYKTTTPFKNFRIFVTAESDPLAKEPTGPTVLSTKAQA